jgi:VIT1/CCC1 family predicted Fe2+/Mn2+ transporter
MHNLKKSALIIERTLGIILLCLGIYWFYQSSSTDSDPHGIVDFAGFCSFILGAIFLVCSFLLKHSKITIIISHALLFLITLFVYIFWFTELIN